MKKSFLKIGIVTFVLLVLFSCKKENENERFIGNYAGTIVSNVYINNSLSYTETNTYTMSVAAGTSNDAIILENEIGATVFQNRYDIDNGETMYSDLENGISIKFFITGSGVLTEANSIVQNWDLTTTYNNSNIEITMKGTLDKLK